MRKMCDDHGGAAASASARRGDAAAPLAAPTAIDSLPDDCLLLIVSKLCQLDRIRNALKCRRWGKVQLRSDAGWRPAAAADRQLYNDSVTAWLQKRKSQTEELSISTSQVGSRGNRSRGRLQLCCVRRRKQKPFIHLTHQEFIERTECFVVLQVKNALPDAVTILKMFQSIPLTALQIGRLHFDSTALSTLHPFSRLWRLAVQCSGVAQSLKRSIIYSNI